MNRAEVISAASLALATIREHKLRSFLTVLGVIIGTGTMIGVGSILTGLDASITNIFRSFGPNTMIAFKFKVGFRFNVSREEAMRRPLTAANARAINERCPSVEYASPYLFADWRQIHRAKYKANDVYNIDIGGTEEGYAAGGTVMLHGRFLSEMDNRHHLPVAVIGEDLSKAWFRNIEPVGKWFDLDGHQFEVIGVMQRPAASFPGEEDLRVLLPYTTMHKLFPAAK
jgi:putative ABC transport system permease protein